MGLVLDVCTLDRCEGWHGLAFPQWTADVILSAENAALLEPLKEIARLFDIIRRGMQVQRMMSTPDVVTRIPLAELTLAPGPETEAFRGAMVLPQESFGEGEEV